MTPVGLMRRPGAAAFGRFRRDERGASAVEFALVAAPFVAFLLGILQVGVFYMTQSSLDAGVIRTADTLRNNFTSNATTLPSASSLKTQVANNSGGMVRNAATLSVDIRQITNLDGAAVPIADGTADYGSTTSTLVLRAEAVAVTFAPGFSALTKVRSSALVRRQGR